MIERLRDALIAIRNMHSSIGTTTACTSGCAGGWPCRTWFTAAEALNDLIDEQGEWNDPS